MTSTVPTRPRSRRLAATLVLAGVGLTACADGTVDAAVSDAESLTSDAADALDEDAAEAEARSAEVVAALREAGLETLASAVALVDINDVAGSDQFTLFAPNDDAFLALTADELADLTSDVDLLTTTLQAHIVDGTVTASELTEMAEVATVAGTTLAVTVDGDTVTVGDATVIETDVTAGDGVVHVVDSLLAAE